MRTEHDTVVLDVVGDVDIEGARHVIESASAAAAGARAVAIDLADVGSVSEEAAAALLFCASSTGSDGTAEITLRTSSRPGRDAVLRAYARRRARHSSIA